MSDLKILNITRGDSQSDLLNKLNYNFGSIQQNLGGVNGFSGLPGGIGPNGPTGPTGSIGKTGQRGAKWFVENSQPSNPKAGDFWVDLSGDCEVYKWDGVSWVNQGFSISQSGIFEISPLQTGLTSGSPDSGYVQNLFNPESKTLILTGATGTNGSNVRNPQLSKVIIGNGGTSGYPLLEFSKTDLLEDTAFTNKTPAFLWISNTTGSPNSYGLKWRLKNGADFRTKSTNIKARTRFYLEIGDYLEDYQDKENRISFSASNNIYLQAGGESSSFVFTLSQINCSFNNFSFASLSNSFFIDARVRFYSQYTSSSPNFLSTYRFLYKRGIAQNGTDNYIRFKFSGESNFSSPGLQGDYEILKVNAEGNAIATKKISAFTFRTNIFTTDPNYEKSGIYTDVNGLGRPFFTLTATNSWIGYGGTDPYPLYRISFNEFYLFIPNSTYATTRNALAIHIPVGNTTSVRKDGINLLTWPGSGTSNADNYFGIGQSVKFNIISGGTVTWNALILDANQNSTTPRVGNQGATGTGFWNFTGGATPVATGRLYARMDATDINVAAKFTKLIVTRVSQYQFMVTHESIVSADWSSTGSDYGYMVTGTLYNPNY